MDYMYGELNDLVKNINYEGKTTNTANTVVDNINRTIKVDVNFEGIDYTALWTDTARMNQDKSARTYSVDVIKVPNDLNFVANTVNAEEKIFNGSENIDIDLRPLVFANSRETEFVSENTKQLFRNNDQEGVFYIEREGIPPVILTVQNTVNNNSEINANRILESLNPTTKAESLFDYATETKLYSNKGFTIIQSDESEYEIDAFRLGSSSATGSLTLHFRSPVSGIKVNASIYCSTSGKYDKNTDLYINGIAVGVGNLFEEFTVNFDEPTDTVTFENRKTSSDAGRIWIDKFITLPGSDRYVPVELVGMKNGVIRASEDAYNAITIEGGAVTLHNEDTNAIIELGSDATYIRGFTEFNDNSFYSDGHVDFNGEVNFEDDVYNSKTFTLGPESELMIWNSSRIKFQSSDGWYDILDTSVDQGEQVAIKNVRYIWDAPTFSDGLYIAKERGSDYEPVRGEGNGLKFKYDDDEKKYLVTNNCLFDNEVNDNWEEIRRHTKVMGIGTSYGDRISDDGSVYFGANGNDWEIKLCDYGVGLYNQDSREFDYIRPGTDGGDFNCIHTDTFGAYELRTTKICDYFGGYGLSMPDTENWEADKTLTAEEDLENIFTPEADFTVDMQHFYKVGKMVFGHIVLHRNSAVSSTGIYKVGTCSKHAQHEHLFTATCFNGSTANNDAAILKTTGELDLRLTGTTSASTYKWDLSFFFCEEN